MRDLKAAKTRPKPVAANRVRKPRRERKPINFRRYIRAAARLAVWGGGIAAVVAALFIGYRLLSQVVFFRLDVIEVTGTRRLSREDAVAIAGVRKGEDLLGLDLDRIGEQLGKNPWIKKVTLRRYFPHTLSIRLTEHEPVAVANLGLLYYVDRDGEIFKPLNEGDSLDFPVVTGITEEDLAKDRQGTAEALKEVGRLVALLQAGKVFRLENVSEIHWDNGFGFTLFTMNGGVPIKLGSEGYEEKLARFARVYDQLQPQMPALEYVDLNYGDKIVVKKV